MSKQREVSSPIIFRCQRCGDCCKNLLNFDDTLGIKTGLALTPDEIGLFPADAISPTLGFGHLGNGVPKRIIGYQVSVDVCPHLSWEGALASCTIYKKRPLICRMYPWMPFFIEDTMILGKCRGMPDEAEFNEQLSVPPGVEKLLKVRRQKLKRAMEGTAYGELVSQFDLGSKTWYRVCRAGEVRKEALPLTYTPLALEATGD